MASNGYAIQDGEMVRTEAAVIPAVSSAASYGDGCFETWRSYSGSLATATVHLQRLRQSMAYLGMMPSPDFSDGRIEKQAGKLLEINGLMDQDARLRLQVWRLGGLGYKTSATDKIGWLLTATPVRAYSQPIRLATVSQHRIPSQALAAGFKLSNGLNYILARREAARKGYDDALMLDARGHVSETTIANVFWKKGNMVYTPSEHCDLLPGITRACLIRWLEHRDELTLKTGSFTLGELLQAEMVWLTNSVQEIVPVSAIEETEFSSAGPFLTQMKKAYRDMIVYG